MKIETKKVETYTITDYSYMSKEGDYISMTKWANREGFDIDINGNQLFSLSDTDIEAIITVLLLNNEISLGDILVKVEELRDDLSREINQEKET